VATRTAVTGTCTGTRSREIGAPGRQRRCGAAGAPSVPVRPRR
jgi:hypothetical protein